MSIEIQEQEVSVQMVSVGDASKAISTTTVELEWRLTATPDLMAALRLAVDPSPLSPEGFDERMAWFLSDDSLDWDAVERARAEGWS